MKDAVVISNKNSIKKENTEISIKKENTEIRMICHLKFKMLNNTAETKIGKDDHYPVNSQKLLWVFLIRCTKFSQNQEFITSNTWE